jgi:NADP-dependent 3-hydroxy acid dehydrogenase YdfG
VTSSTRRPTAIVTGASSGIGEATARRLTAQGWHVVLGARRAELIEKIAAEIDGTAVPLDVTDAASVGAFVDRIDQARVLVNNAGGAKGLEPVVDADEEHWRWMWETNVLGTLRVTKALLPVLIASGDGHVVTVTSTAAYEAYENGSGYTSAKSAQSVLHRTLRTELLGQPIRLTEIVPGMVETDFSLVRFDGDAQKAAEVYSGVEALTPEDVAEVIGFAVSRPPHVNLDQIVLRPRDQASQFRIHRR